MKSSTLSSLRSTMSALFTGAESKYELANPYELTDNAEMKMRNAYGIKVLEGVPADGPTNQTWYDQSVGIVLVKRLNTTDNNPLPLSSLTGDLCSDMDTIKTELLCNRPTGSIKITYSGHSPIEMVGTHVSVELLFTLTFSEDL